MTTRTTTVLLAALLASCAASSPKGENWTYVGPDPTYRNPPPMPRGGLTTAEWQLEIQQKMMDWQRRNREAVEQSKAACAGDSGAFPACMKVHGWMRGSNPL